MSQNCEATPPSPHCCLLSTSCTRHSKITYPTYPTYPVVRREIQVYLYPQENLPVPADYIELRFFFPSVFHSHIQDPQRVYCSQTWTSPGWWYWTGATWGLNLMSKFVKNVPSFEFLNDETFMVSTFTLFLEPWITPPHCSYVSFPWCALMLKRLIFPTMLHLYSCSPSVSWTEVEVL